MSQDVQIPGDLMGMGRMGNKTKIFLCVSFEVKIIFLFEFDDKLDFTEMNRT